MLSGVLASSVALPPAAAAAASPAAAGTDRSAAVMAPASGEASVVVVLASRDRSHDRARLAQLATEKAARPQRMAARRAEVAGFAPTQAMRSAVLSFASTFGLTVGATSSYTMELRGPRQVLADAFHAQIVEDRTSYHTRAPLMVPAALAGVADGVSGLDTRTVFHPRAVPSGFQNASLRAAYQYSNSAAGAGVTVATAQFAPFNPADFNGYARAAGITLRPSQITGVSVQGAVTTATPGDIEDTLDIEALLATAPAASQRVYVADQNISGAITQAYSQIADDVVAGTVQVVSTSWGACEADTGTYAATLDPIFQRIVAAGGTVFAAAGDSGAYDCSLPGFPDARVSVDYPAASPYVVGVGGTHAVLTSGSYQETVWSEPKASGSAATTFQGNATGGGQSVSEPRPAYQSGVALAGTHRLVPDISSVGDPNTGLGVYYNSGWILGGGTSLSAPVEAGLLAAAESAAGRTAGVGDIHAALYQNRGAFRDITSGSNYVYSAGPGFDETTGLGSPLWDTLAPHVVPGYPLPPSALHFTPLAPARILDTRTGTGAPVGSVGPGVTIRLQVAGLGGVPSSASAVVMNVTAVAPTAGGYVTVYPSNLNRPNASNLNLLAGRTTPNLVTVELAPDGSVNLFNAVGAVDLLADVAGYYSTGSPSTFAPLPPARILDTRTGTGAPKAPVGAGGTITVQVTGVGGVPAGATAVILNVTAVIPSAGGYVTVYPADLARPNASNLNLTPHVTLPNLVSVKLSAQGTVTLYNNAGSVNLLADVAGYYTPSTATLFTPLAPARILDTRTGTGAPKAAVGPGATIRLQVAGAGGVPVGATAVIVNVAAVSPTSGGYITVYPSNLSRPNASSLNVSPLVTVANLVVVKLAADGSASLYNNAGSVDLLADVAGYYA